VGSNVLDLHSFYCAGNLAAIIPKSSPMLILAHSIDRAKCLEFRSESIPGKIANKY